MLWLNQPAGALTHSNQLATATVALSGTLTLGSCSCCAINGPGDQLLLRWVLGGEPEGSCTLPLLPLLSAEEEEFNFAIVQLHSMTELGVPSSQRSLGRRVGLVAWGCPANVVAGPKSILQINDTEPCMHWWCFAQQATTGGWGWSSTMLFRVRGSSDTRVGMAKIRH